MDSALKLEWRNINYSVPICEQTNYTFWKTCRKTKEIQILNDVNGQMKTGDLVAVLGCSGAGKTSLLAAISQRLRGNLTGDVVLNGVVVNRSQMTQLSSFLPQFDINVKTFTAYEHLYFMSHFKMHRKTTRLQRCQQVNDLLVAVGLLESAKTQIQHLSGGERKRLSLAEELLTDPPFLFCDEPTTGLDSYSAYSVVKTLRHLCTRQRITQKSFNSLYEDNDEDETSTKTNSIELDLFGAENQYIDASQDLQSPKFLMEKQKKAIICSIHQPTSDIFELFTHIIIMNAGRLVFQGSTENALIFFNNLGYPVPKNCNPADFYLKTLSDHSIAEKALLSYEHDVDGMYSGSWLTPKTFGGEYLSHMNNFKKIRWISQVYLILNRFFIEDMRNIKFLLINLGLFMITSVTLSVIYSGMNELSQTSVQDISGSMFMLSTEIIFTFSYGVVYVFPSALPILRRDVGEGTYSLSAYFVAVLLSFLPMAFFKSFMFFSLIYGTLFFNRGLMLFLSMGFVLSLSAVAATGYGIFLSSVFESDRMATECAAPFDLLFLCLGGVYYNVDSIPFLKYISLFFYANEALMYDFWIGVDNIACSKEMTHPCLANGLEVLKQGSYRTADDTFWLDCSGLLMIAVIFNFFAYLLIRKYVKRSGYY